MTLQGRPLILIEILACVAAVITIYQTTAVHFNTDTVLLQFFAWAGGAGVARFFMAPRS